MSEITAIEPVVKSLHVDCTVERAFEVFTGNLAAWWPTELHSIHGDRVRDVVVERRAGGEIYEVSLDGDRAHWGTITTWEPPERLVVAWRVNPAVAAETEWEARFSVEGGGTLLEFEHRFWERLGEGATDSRESYDVGWNAVLTRYVDSAGRPAGRGAARRSRRGA